MVKDESFGNVEVNCCDFCGETVKRQFFYALKINSFNPFSMFSKSKIKLQEGICFKCMLKGISEICNNDMAEIKKYLSLYFKNETLDKMGGK